MQKTTNLSPSAKADLELIFGTSPDSAYADDLIGFDDFKPAKKVRKKPGPPKRPIDQVAYSPLAKKGYYEGTGVEYIRRTKISEEQCEEVIKYMGLEGVPLRPACAAFGLAFATVHSMIYSTPRLKDLDRMARESYLRTQVRRMNEIADEEEDVQRARLKCDNIKWEAQRVARFEYGDNVVVSGDKEAPLVIQLVQATDNILAKLKEREENTIDITPSK